MATLSSNADDSNSEERTNLNHSAIDEPSNPYYLHHSPWQVLVSQQLSDENYTKEQQRRPNPSSDSSNSTGTMAFAVKTDVARSGGPSSQNSQNSHFTDPKNQKRDMPYCTHCRILGHTVDRCYKIHGYPPSYKFRSNNNYNASAHQVSTTDNKSDHSNSFGGFVQNLNFDQYQQLMSMLSTHLSSSAKVTNAPDPAQTNCLAAGAFVSLHSIHHTTVTLPNHSQILVHFASDVKLHSDLVLKDVLFVPQFKFNLISVSALVTGSALTVSFLPDCFVIQDLSTKRMIGRGDKVQDLYILNVRCLNSNSNAFVNNVSAHI
ncbi:hypothetical protein Patl1_37338 [Pistacia atlantica]|nr:hypothetical protein Patl1_37338 [Pistacia atlantica]